MELTKRQIVLLALQFTAVFLFIGRGWQHLYLGFPYYAFFYGNHMRPVVELVGMDWVQYLKDPESGKLMVQFVRNLGWIYLLLAVIALFFQYISKRVAQVFVATAVSLLIFLSLSYFLGQAKRVGQFVEYSCQMGTPIFLYLARFGHPLSQQFLLWLKIAIALTFCGHGLYAIGYYPQPGYFMEMISRGLSVDLKTARLLLETAGVLDFILSCLIFLPVRWLVLPALVWAVIWGLITTGARLFTNIYPDIFWDTVWRNTPDMLMRFPHFMIPLVALFLVINHAQRTRSV
ncbi:MAG: hypothetical protein AAGK47_04805 [Bacteroidota bacterium]